MYANSLLIVLLAILVTVQAHFTMKFPESIGFDDEKEGDVPCGGFNDFENATAYNIQNNVIAVLSSHPQSSWAFRAQQFPVRTGNWTNLLPYITQSGIGAYCPQGINVPESWAGSAGVIQVVQGGSDGTLHQCAAVNFVSGKLADKPSSCTNGTDLKASFAPDATFSQVMATETAAPTAAVTSGSGTSSASTTSTAAGSAASATASSAAAPPRFPPALHKTSDFGLYVEGGLFLLWVTISARLFA